MASESVKPLKILKLSDKIKETENVDETDVSIKARVFFVRFH